MKQVKLTASVLLIATVVIIGCNKQGEITKPSTKQAIDKKAESAKMMDYLVTAWAYKKEDIQEMTDRFVIQGDIAIPKKDFWTYYTISNDPSGRHYHTNFLVTATDVINVGIDPSVPAEWKIAYVDAMLRWNALGGKITFNNCNCTPVHGIWVNYQPLSSDRIAETNPPRGDGYAGIYSTINSTLGTPLSYSEKLKTAAHELGHAIGFGHTDNPISGVADKKITVNFWCDNFSDYPSVMTPGNSSFSDFSSCDKDAFKVLYSK